jgi:hypothetical protein
MLQVLIAIPLKFCCRKETGGYVKGFHEKKKKKEKKES